MPDVGSVKYKVELDNSQLDHDISSTESEISSKLDAISGKLGQSLGYQVFKDIGSAAIKAGEAMVGFAAGSVEVGQTFDKSMSQVAATMGVTVDEVQELRDFAQEMGASTAFSASQAADALNYMALAGYDAEKSMEMLPTVLDLAAAGDIELARASDMVTDAASALGLTTEETAEMVDKMAQASSKSNTSVAQLGDAILTVGGTAKNLTGGTTELATALGIMADSSIKGAEGGTHLRNILLALNPTTKDAIEAFEELGINAYDAEGNLRPLNDTFSELSVRLQDYTDQEKQDLLTKMFNKTDLAAVDSLLTAATYDMDGLKDAVGRLGINWDSVRAITEDWGLSAEEGMEEVIRTTENWILSGSTMEQTLKLLRDSYGMTQDDAVALFETVSAELDNQGNRWTELTGYIDDATGAAEKMADTQLDNLAGDITLMQSALEGVQIAISDALTPTLREFVQFGGSALQELSTAFKEGGLGGAVDAISNILNEGIQLILSKAPDFVESGMRLISSFVVGFVDSLPNVLDAGLKLVLTLADGIISRIPQLMYSAVKLIRGLAQFIIDNADVITEKGIELIAALVEGLLYAIPDMVEAIPTIIHAIWEVFTNFNWISLGVDIIRGIARGIAGAAGEIASAAMDAARNALDAAKSFLGIHSPSTRAAKEIGEPYSEGVAEGIDDGMSEIDKSLGIMERSLTAGVDLPDIGRLAGDLGAAITASSSAQIVVPVNIDGREVARSTAWYMNEQLAWEAR